jgi:hypothetical protein
LAHADNRLAQPAKQPAPCWPSLRLPVNCRITSYSSGEVLDTVEMIVLARAYRAAWRSLFATDPVGRHVIAPLDAVLVFHPEARLL